MSCVGGRNCKETEVLSIKSHGLTVGLCETHEAEARKVITDDGRLTSADHIHDYLRLCIILQSRELFSKAMKDFSNEVSRAEKSLQDKSSWFNREKIAIRLNSSLSRYEGLCWFGRQQKIMSGLLTFKEFKGAIQNGYMVKDPGPGPDHGEYSHRLQWQYIMRVVTNKFTVPKTTDFKLSPLQMYCGMFDTNNVWGAILEGANMMVNRPGSPDWINRQFTTDTTLSSTSLGTTLRRRFDRRSAMVTQVKTALQARGKVANPKLKVQEFATAPKKAGEVNVHGVIEYLYKWKKAGRPKVGPGNDATIEHSEAWNLWDTVYNQKYQKKTANLKFHRAVDPDTADDLVQTVSDGLLLHGSAEITDAPITGRLNQSKSKLNQAFSYSTSVGARKRTI